MSNEQQRIVALLSGPDQPGLVAKVSNWIYARGGNIYHADQHRDDEAKVFFQRVEWIPGSDNHVEEAEQFRALGMGELDMQVTIGFSQAKPKVLIFVSKISHCFHDIVLRFREGEMPGELVGVISNHETLRGDCERYGLPFFHIPVTPNTKVDAEQQQIKIASNLGAELIIRARYMQILSADFLRKVGCPVINIHHSFLPAFAGGKPYHQANQRGVKLIGATAHYATVDLDEGPIIAQDVSRVSHRNNVEDLMRRGKDLEKSVFAQAVRWHLQNRILVYHNKTVIFD